MFRKLVAILNTPISFSSAPAEEKELEFEPLEEEVGMPIPRFPFDSPVANLPVATPPIEVGMPIPRYIPSPAVEPVLTPEPLEPKPIVITDDEEVAPPPPALFPETAKELEVAQNNLEFLNSSKAQALAEAAMMEEVHETNKAIRQLVLEMGDQRLLPSQLEQRRMKVTEDNKSVAEMLKDLGF